MKKLISTILAVGLLSSAGAVQAQPTYPLVLTGSVDVQKGTGPLLVCDLSVTVDLVGGVSKVTAVSLGAGDPRCVTVQFPGGPWDKVYDPVTHDFTIPYIFADTTVTPGDCAGSISAEWDGTEYAIDGVLPEVDTGTGDCTIVGYVAP